MPSAALTVNGNLASQQGTGTSVSFTAGNAVSIGGNLNVGAGTSFTSGAYTHTLGGNLAVNGTYNSTGNRLVFNGSGIQQVIMPAALNKVIVNKTAGLVSLTSDLTINDSLIFMQRVIRTGAFKIVSVTGRVSNSGQSTGWVYGKIQKPVATGSNVTRTFETGDSLVYAPVMVTFGTVTTSGTVVVHAPSTDHPLVNFSMINPSRSVNRYWNFTNSGISFSNASFTFTWGVTDPDVPSSPEYFKVARYITAWDTLPSLISGATSIQVSGVSAFGDFVIGEVCDASITGIWTGYINSDWFTSENWRCGILPGSTSDITIPSGLAQYPVLSTGTTAVKNILIQPGASLTVSSGTIQVSGVITSNGTMNFTSGGLELNGITTQVLAATLFSGSLLENLTANNLSGVNITGSLSVSGRLKVSQGVLNTGGTLLLVATATQTALIDGSGTGTISGNVTMQRYLPSAFGYKYISSPFQSATVSEIADEIDLAATFPMLYRYDEQQDVTGWVEYTAVSGALVPLTGYAANFGSSGSPITLDISGTVSTGNQSVSLFNNNKPFTQGFNLVGNPYPSPIDWDNLAGWNRNNIDDAVYYFDASASDMFGGVYSSYINGISSNGVAGNIIPSMQGFFVHVTDGAYPVAATLSVNNAARTNDLQPGFHRNTSSTSYPMVRLNAVFREKVQQDDMVVYFDQEATAEYEKTKDALKLINTDPEVPSFYSLSPQQVKLSINAVPESGFLLDVPLGIRVDRSGTVDFSLQELTDIPPGINLYLTDDSRRINYNLRNNPVVSIALDKGIIEGRFRLRFTPGVLPYVSDTDELGVYAAGSQVFLFVDVSPGESGSVSISSLDGKLLFEKQYDSGYYTLNSDFSSGIYLVNFRSGKATFSKKIFIRND